MSARYRITVHQSDAPNGSASVDLEGELDFESVPAVLPELQSLLQKNAKLSLNLAGVAAANSAALALLMELRRNAHKLGHALSISHLPDSILKIARVCEAEELLATSS